ncbi:MAG: 50S ribosomal protein L15 [Candidatus Marinimicrobia bacterium]|nr:50S ribosomal protein L15 [Candidatus Neomarinimicrobiota bacterium]|tara:strand:- start:3676 stop:4128 length:453 start_codon:yes stop_codon:yes gene_type:complete
MKLDSLTPSQGSVRGRKRIGRGNATGQGRTAGKGHKGYKSRSGAKRKLYFEGGQTPLARRLPKRGMGTGKFNHMQTKKSMQILSLADLNNFDEKNITPEFLAEKGVINQNFPYKILGNGNVEGLNNVYANFFSKKAIEKIESAGGKVNFI